MAQIQFNAAVIDPRGDRTPVPAGTYDVVLGASSVEATKNNSGKMIACQFKVIAGEFAGKTVFNNLNFLNQNPVAQEIGQSKLSALCHAVGVLQIQDTMQLHGIPLKIVVSLSEDNKYNEVDAFQRADGQAIVKGVASPAGGQQAQAPQWAQPAQQPQQQAPANVVPMQQPQAPAQQPWQQPAQQPQPQQQMPAAQPPQAWQQPQAPAQQPPQQFQQPAPQQAPGAPVTPPWVKQ